MTMKLGFELLVDLSDLFDREARDARWRGDLLEAERLEAISDEVSEMWLDRTAKALGLEAS